MFQCLSRLALGATLLAGVTVGQQMSETVPVTTNDPALVGFEADCYGSNFSTFALVGYVARVGTFNFGSGTIASQGLFSNTALTYDALGFKFSVKPDIWWGLWVAGGDSLTFEVKY